VFIGVGKRGTLWGVINPKVFQLTEAGSETSAYLSKRLGLTELAKEHGNKLVPASEALGGMFRPGVTNCLQEIALVKDL
jgi:hypothetical protein